MFLTNSEALDEMHHARIQKGLSEARGPTLIRGGPTLTTVLFFILFLTNVFFCLLFSL